MQEQRLAFVGFGNVGQALARLLLRKGENAPPWRAVAIATGSHGLASDPEGLDLEQALVLAAAGADLSELNRGTAPADTFALIEGCGATVLFENSPVDYHTGQPALDHLRTALQSGMHAITANKGPLVHGYTELRQLATQVERRFLFESTVMDGAPIFSLWRRALLGARLLGFRGILNSTTNLVLSRMQQGETLEAAVAHAQSIGLAETDPSGDIDGWDAAIKTAALVTVLMDYPLLPEAVERDGIRRLTVDQVQAAEAAGQRWKLVCQASRDGDEVAASVRPELLGADDPLFGIIGADSAVTFETDVLGPLTVISGNPGPDTTAYGLYADFLAAVKYS